MGRFETLNGIYANVDEIKCFYRLRNNPEYLVVELKDGEKIEVCDSRHIYENYYLPGVSAIKQVVPAVEPLYIVSKCEDDCGIKYYEVEKSNYLALCEDGNVYPLTNSFEGYFEIDDGYNEVYEEYAYKLWKKGANMRVVEYFKGECYEDLHAR